MKASEESTGAFVWRHGLAKTRAGTRTGTRAEAMAETRNRSGAKSRRTSGTKPRKSSGTKSRKNSGAKPRKSAGTGTKGKIKKYRKPLNLNIGMSIFGAIFIYVVVCVIMYSQPSHIVRYEVQEGSLAADTIYRGIVLRDETVVCAESAGYVNYYAWEGSRVAQNDLVYVVDETGRLNEELESMYLGENSLTDEELAEFRNEIVNFVHGFTPVNYDVTYDFKYSLKNTVLRLAGANMLQSIGDVNGTGAGIVNSFRAPVTGIVAYWTDGYEALSAQDVTAEILDEKEYEKKRMLNNTLVESGEAVYKLSTNEDWSIVIPVDPDRGLELQEAGTVKVRFLKNQYESWGTTKLLTNADGNTYIQLTFTNSMITFISERFLDVELIVEDEKGLKIPVSSIVQKEFFLIPEEYVIPGGANGGDSIVRQCYLEDGTISSEIVEIEVYYFDSESKEYYLDSSMLASGENLYKPDSEETFTVSKRATLIGVYNMNKGYADFKQITILYENDEYAIVKPNTKYGLNVYDYIVLNAESVRDDQFINQK